MIPRKDARGTGDEPFDIEEGKDMGEIPRIGVAEAHERGMAGRALLVCGYEDEERCNKVMLKGAISLARFQSLLPSLSRDQKIIFY